MLYVNSTEQLNDLAVKLKKNLKSPLTRIKSAIVKAEGFSHISAFKAALAADTNTVSNFIVSTSDLSVIDDVRWWLESNVDMDTEICFDNDGKVDSAVALPVFERLVGNIESLGHKKNVKENQAWIADMVENSALLAERNKHEYGYETDDAFFEATEDAVTDGAQAIAKHSQLAEALALLEASGLSDISDKLKCLTEDAIVFSELI